MINIVDHHKQWLDKECHTSTTESSIKLFDSGVFDYVHVFVKAVVAGHSL